MPTFEDFLRAHLPAPPARVLEVGCGSGELTTALAVAGYDALGIDPLAPQGDRFRRLKLEDLEEEHAWDAVLASHALHHLRDLAGGLDRIAALLRPGGVLLLDEKGWDLADDATLDWFWSQRRSLAAAGGPPAPASLEEARHEWEAEHVGVHGFVALRAELAERFEEVAFEAAPYLYRHLRGVAVKELEQALADAGAIRALGFRYAGRPRSRRSPGG